MTVSLSSREIEIIELVAEGLTNQEIAERLTISKRTVDNHVSNVFTKTGSKNRVALLNWAMDHGKICLKLFNKSGKGNIDNTAINGCQKNSHGDSRHG